MNKEIIETRAQSNKLLTPRLKINEKCQSKDFQAWLQSRLVYDIGDNILDLCCGDGAQAIPFSRRIGKTGNLTCVDINLDSINAIKSILGNNSNVKIVQSEMMDTENYLNIHSEEIYYDLIHCSFALPYANDPLGLLSILYKRLSVNGRMSISLPCNPHGMVEFCEAFYQIPESVKSAIQLGESYVVKHMRRFFGEVDIFYFNSKIVFKNIEDFLEIYRCTTYYNKTYENEIIKKIEFLINANREVAFDKCAILITGRDFSHGGIGE